MIKYSTRVKIYSKELINIIYKKLYMKKYFDDNNKN